jgi:hypothetical protein
MKILVINNDGGGFADYIEFPAETTVRGLFQQQIQSLCSAASIPFRQEVRFGAASGSAAGSGAMGGCWAR